MAARLSIGVVGAGIGGLAAALALARAGHGATVLERAEELGEVGAGLQLSPNAMKAMRFLGLEAEAEAAGFAPEAIELRMHRSGRTVFRALLGAAARARWGASYIQIHRADLHGLLADAARAAGVEIRTGEAVTGVRADEGGAILDTARGEARFDLVVGADGVRSLLRDHVAPGPGAAFSGYVAFRGLADAARLPENLVRPVASAWMGPRAHFVHYYLRRGEIVNFVGVIERAAWTEESWSLPADIRALRARFLDWHESVRAVLAAADTTFEWGLFGHAPLARWSRGRVVLLGDAAHPTTPFLAQGAGMALEDAVFLARALEGRGVEDALEAFEAARKPRASRLQAAAARTGGRFHSRSLPERLAKAGAIAALGALAPGRAAALNDWIYSYDPARAPL